MKLLSMLVLLSTQALMAATTYEDVRPIIKENCLSCHDAAVKLHGVNLAGYNETLDYVVPGEPVQSEMWGRDRFGKDAFGKEVEPGRKENHQEVDHGWGPSITDTITDVGQIPICPGGQMGKETHSFVVIFK